MQVNICIHCIEYYIYDTGLVECHTYTHYICVHVHIVCVHVHAFGMSQKQSPSSNSIKPFNTSLRPVGANAWSV